MNKLYKMGIGGGIIVVILAIIAIVLAVVLTGKKDGTEPRVMYFAMHLGDPDRLSRMSTDFRQSNKAECSLKINVDNTRESIKGLNGVDQRYKFITYTDTVSTTSAMKNEEALMHLDTIVSNSSTSRYNQEHVAEAFMNNKQSGDLLVYYIPCDFDYSTGDDLQRFIKVLEGVPGKALIVSNTKTSQEVAHVFQQRRENVIGVDDHVTERIIVFGGGNETTKTTHMPTTAETIKPQSTKTTKTAKPIPQKSTTVRTTPGRNETTRATRTPTTAESTKPASTTATKTTRPTPQKSTTVRSTPEPTRKGLNCLFVADLYNFADNTEAYDKETDLLSTVAYDVFEESPSPVSVALWAYGHTILPKAVNSSLENMSRDYDSFSKQLEKVEYSSTTDPYSTKKAIEAINEMDDTDKRLNCLLFLTAQMNTGRLPKLNLKNKNIEKIVVVGLNSTHPREVVPQGGKMVTVPYYYIESHIRKVVTAILGGWGPTTAVVTTTSPSSKSSTKPAISTTKIVTVTPEPLKELKCLFVGDMYNFKNDTDAYSMEKELIHTIAYDFFNIQKIRTSAGLWAYGYTNIPETIDLSKITVSHEAFVEQLRDMRYEKSRNYLTTTRAIRNINALPEKEDRANCIVFFSAQQKTQRLPVLDPKNKGIKRIVAVGFNSTDLGGVVGSRGIAVSVPYYWKKSHVADVLDAILGKYEPSTTTPMPTTSKPISTPAPMKNLKCLIVGDLYNFGKNADRYVNEMEFINIFGYDFFGTKRIVTSGGLWAYGYTDFPVSPDSGKINASYDKFVEDLKKMKFVDKSNPSITDDAIAAINMMPAEDERINCLVFFSAQKKTKSLPQINPRNKGITRIVAVGFDYTDLSTVVADRGVAVPVPYYWKDSDVLNVMDAVLGRYKPSPKPTIMPTTPQITTTRTPKENLKCLIVGDLYNFGKNADKYVDEMEFINNLGYDFFGTKGIVTSGGLWAYGYTDFPGSPDSGRINASYDKFVEDLKKMKFVNKTNPSTTDDAIAAINMMPAKDDRINCLVFFSAQKNTGLLPQINPRNKGITRIVAVGFDDTDLSRVVADRGVAVRVPYYWKESHVENVMDAVLGRYKPSPKPTRMPTTRKSTTPKPTTAKPPETFNCLFVGDLYNFGKDADKYFDELDFMSNIGHDFLLINNAIATAGLWAYGYTKFPASPDLRNFTAVYDEFLNRLEGMQYTDVTSPMSTSSAIDVINNIRSAEVNCYCDRGTRCRCNNNKINCVVFFSAQKNTQELPRLNPKDAGITKIVAVGFDGTDLSKIVEDRGVAVSVPYYWKDVDTQNVIRAIIGSYKPSPKPRSTTTQARTTPIPTATTSPIPEEEIKCLFVGDLYNFGKDTDKYEKESELINLVSYDFFETVHATPFGTLWAYGYTDFPESPDLDNMSTDYLEFLEDLETMNFVEKSNPSTTDKAISLINKLPEGEDRINCLVLFSAKENTTSLPLIKPHKGITTIVAVGLNNTDLSPVVDERGLAVSVPYNFTLSDVSAVVEAILESYKPTTIPVSTTHPAPEQNLKCLIVGDLYNFGKNVDKYVNELEFLNILGYDFFGTQKVVTSGGLWAYGYTDFPGSPDSGKINASYDKFVEDLKKMKFVDKRNPSITDDAITAINMMPAKDDRINCLVFFSAQKNTGSLPQINPRNKKITRIVAIGFDGTDLSTVVADGGVAVSVPYYWKESHVENVMDAVLGKYKPSPVPTMMTTTQQLTITKKAVEYLKCLFVLDVYNFGKDVDKYTEEKELLGSITYDFFQFKDVVTTGALWAYGYTNFTASPDLNSFSKIYNDFVEKLQSVEYRLDISSPITTSKAVDAINNLPEGDDRANCLVFFSAQNDTKFLPALNPKNKKIERIVAVGFDGTDLSEVVGTRGVAVSVPFYYVESDIVKVVQAIRGKRP